MGVALGGSELAMPKYLADEVEAVAARYGDRGKAVPKVLKSLKSDIGALLARVMRAASFGPRGSADRWRSATPCAATVSSSLPSGPDANPMAEHSGALQGRNREPRPRSCVIPVQSCQDEDRTFQTYEALLVAFKVT